MGWDGYYKCVAKDIQFRSNTIEGADFGVDATGQEHSYSVYWTLEIQVEDKKGNPVAEKKVRILDQKGTEVYNQLTDRSGVVVCELPEYSLISSEMVFSSPYIVFVGKSKEKIELTSNTELKIVTRRINSNSWGRHSHF